MQKPQLKQDPMYQLLKEGKVQEFNQRRAAGETCGLRNADLRGTDLTRMFHPFLNLAGDMAKLGWFALTGNQTSIKP